MIPAPAPTRTSALATALSPAEAQRAIMQLADCARLPELQRATPHRSPDGQVRPFTGGTAIVYRLELDTRHVALRLFTMPSPARDRRLRIASDYFSGRDETALAPFAYEPTALRIADQDHPAMLMPWVDGVTLDSHIETHLRDTARLKSLAETVVQTLSELEADRIAHGDWHAGNLIVTPEHSLRLLDPDGLYIDALQGTVPDIVGHPDYQHPRRRRFFYNPRMDRFPAHLIIETLTALIFDPDLWRFHIDGEDALLWRAEDLAHPDRSELFRAMLAHRSPAVVEAASRLRRLLDQRPTEIAPPRLHLP